MADPGYAPTQTPDATATRSASSEPGAPPDYPDAPPGTGVNLPLLTVLLVILGLVSASNVWLRRRAEREKSETSEDERQLP